MISLPHLALLVSFSFTFTWVKRKVWLLGLVLLLLSFTQVLFPISVRQFACSVPIWQFASSVRQLARSVKLASSIKLTSPVRQLASVR